VTRNGSFVVLEPLTAAGQLSQWVVTDVDATNVTLGKNPAAVGSGAAPAQLRVTLMRVHSIID